MRDGDKIWLRPLILDFEVRFGRHCMVMWWKEVQCGVCVWREKRREFPVATQRVTGSSLKGEFSVSCRRKNCDGYYCKVYTKWVSIILGKGYACLHLTEKGEPDRRGHIYAKRRVALLCASSTCCNFYIVSCTRTIWRDDNINIAYCLLWQIDILYQLTTPS